MEESLKVSHCCCVCINFLKMFFEPDPNIVSLQLKATEEEVRDEQTKTGKFFSSFNACTS